VLENADAAEEEVVNEEGERRWLIASLYISRDEHNGEVFSIRRTADEGEYIFHHAWDDTRLVFISTLYIKQNLEFDE
jgi:hypothetical protein